MGAASTPMATKQLELRRQTDTETWEQPPLMRCPEGPQGRFVGALFGTKQDLRQISNIKTQYLLLQLPKDTRENVRPL